MKTKLLMVLMLCFGALTAWGQRIVTEGTVIAANTNEPLIGATVYVKGTTSGTVTNVDGGFSIAADQGATLVFSCLGFKTIELPANGYKDMVVKMEEDIQLLETIVVVGYGVTKKTDVTGSAVRANLKDFEKVANTNVMQSLQGTVPGLNVGQVTSAGGSPSIQIRGKNTISGSTDVLIVLDGIIYTGDLASINPADIESIDVLKDASATAVYGAQAANGVLLITSKKGQQGKARITFSSSYSIQT
ncbi:MAG: TonB-dependent receptor plug domain-containing protein, partial [Clostridium sp.]|nr:TonB-dependent receptor plug domain-containing protein [Clostridium sp.]